ncbi:MAG: hypothetical protein G01um101430_633 [Parcubacteria group bacterium Gr01-1014_30]|nr:MAG: hypothetical protein G01um101430_633 [Parcubacteria group bacterium Gr01-1014_30]
MSGQPNEITYDDDFWKDAKYLPKKAQDKLGFLIELMRKDAFDPRLHTKRLGVPLQDAFSFRITRDYRVGFIFLAPRVIKLLAVDSRDKIYKRLSRKI